MSYSLLLDIVFYYHSDFIRICKIQYIQKMGIYTEVHTYTYIPPQIFDNLHYQEKYFLYYIYIKLSKKYFQIEM